MGGVRRGGGSGYDGGGGGGTCAAYFAFLGVIRAEIPRRKSDTVAQRLERRYMVHRYMHIYVFYIIIRGISPSAVCDGQTDVFYTRLECFVLFFELNIHTCITHIHQTQWFSTWERAPLGRSDNISGEVVNIFKSNETCKRYFWLFIFNRDIIK